MKKLLLSTLVGLALLTCQTSFAQKTKGKFSPIKVETPARPANQQDVIQLVTPKLETVRVGFIGLGMRGPGAVERWTHIPGTQIVALCDLLPERVENAQKILEKAGLPKAASYTGDEKAWKKLCERDDIDVVYIATDWKLTSLNMAQQGVFGEVLHVEGAYIHNLEDFWPYYWNNWRMDYNQKHRGDVYATHGMGPACQVLNIHRGDRMKTLVAMDTKAVNGPAYIKKSTGKEVKDFQNGDQTTTLIRTENGKTMLIQHNVMTPRPYSRMYQVVGADGYASKYPIEEYCLRPTQVDSNDVPNHEKLNAHGSVSEDVKKALMAKYKDPIHKELEETAKKVGGHGGMDYIMDYRLVYCLRNGLPLDMDVYDLAEWCCMAELTRLSIENGSAPVEVPDFTRGGWNKVQGYRHAFAE